VSEGLLDSDAASRLIGVTPNELAKLVKDGIIDRQNGKFHIIGLVRKYIEHLKTEAKRKEEKPTQVEIAKHLDMSERNLRDVLRTLDIDHKQHTLSEITTAYIRDMREKAAGRGGDDQANLSKARAEESMIKTALARLDYNERLGNLILGEDVAGVMNEWARSTNREIQQGFHKLVGEIQSTYKITVEPKLVEDIAIPATERIKDHAEKVGRDLIASGE